MKKILFALVTCSACLPASAQNYEVLTGDTKLACEAILCLSTGQRPNECAPSIKRYFDISRKKWSDTVKDRRKFLNKCPSVNEDNTMKQLANAISDGAGKCSASDLNQIRMFFWNSVSDSMMWVIQNKMPGYCDAYWNHAYTDLARPYYVGVPERGGYWVEQAQYPQAIAAYKARIEQEDAQKEAAQKKRYYFN